MAHVRRTLLSDPYVFSYVGVVYKVDRRFPASYNVFPRFVLVTLWVALRLKFLISDPDCSLKVSEPGSYFLITFMKNIFPAFVSCNFERIFASFFSEKNTCSF